MKRILFLIILLLIVVGCSNEVQKSSTTADESVSGAKGKVPIINESYREIKLNCTNLTFGSKVEWEARGFTVEQGVAKNFKGEFNISKQKICKDTDSVMRCKQKCSEINARLEGLNIEYEEITCGCFIE